MGEALKRNRTLESLNLYGCDIMSEGLSRLSEGLSQHPRLREVTISDNIIDDTGAKIVADILRSNKSLEKINMGKNYITAMGAKEILQATNSTTTALVPKVAINLKGNQIEESQVEILAECNKLMGRQRWKSEIRMSEL